LGHGHTDNPAEEDIRGWTMAGSVDHFIRFLETLDAGPYHLVGQSRGGYVVTRTALERPDLVASLTIGDSNTVAPGGARNEGIHLRNPHPSGSLKAMEFTTNLYYFSPEALSRSLIQKKLDLLATPKIKAAIACIAVVDDCGQLIAFERMEGGKVTSSTIAIDKAFTAAAAKKATHEYGAASQPGSAAYGINSALGGRLMVVGGGLPVVHGAEVVGGIGISSGTPAQDLAVAQAAIDHWAAAAG